MDENTKKIIDKLYDAITERIIVLSNYSISKEQARGAARKFVQLCQKLAEIEVRIETERRGEQ